jgi:hypothetical protein
MCWLTLLAAIGRAPCSLVRWYPREAEAGCCRPGLGVYHWYDACFGPHFIYPHRACTHGYCGYH